MTRSFLNGLARIRARDEGTGVVLLLGFHSGVSRTKRSPQEDDRGYDQESEDEEDLGRRRTIRTLDSP